MLGQRVKSQKNTGTPVKKARFNIILFNNSGNSEQQYITSLNFYQEQKVKNELLSTFPAVRGIRKFGVKLKLHFAY